MSMIRIRPEKVEALYTIIKLDKGARKKYPDNPKKWWKNKAVASKTLGISRPTIDKIILIYPDGLPKKPKKMKPKYFDEFEKTKIWKKIKDFYWDHRLKGLTKRGDAVKTVAREMFRITKGKGFEYFDEDDLAIFWGTPDTPPHPDFVDPQTGKLAFAKASSIRMCMKLMKRGHLVDDPRFSTKGLKREAGRKKGWYLEMDHIIKVIGVIKEVDTLILFLLGILFGGRFNALQRIKVKDIDKEAEIIDVYESKVRRTVEKYLPSSKVLELLTTYIDDFNIKDKLFRWSLHIYNYRLKVASKDAELPFLMSSHILKHTAITQMSLHGVDVDVIEDYVGTEARTIRAFYRGGGDKKIKAQIRGEAFEYESWANFINRLMPYFFERYNYIKPMSISVDGIRLKK